jgi:pilus assembly protein CpaC
MSRNLTRDLGVNWSAMAQIGKYTTIAGATANILANLTTPVSSASVANKGINAVIDALAQDQMVHMLAEPNLTAMSGETASFLVGGEFPIPVAQQNNQTTIEFKQYGVSLAFVPTVISDGHISLKVRPEVSQLTSQGAVQLAAGNSTIQIPAISVRRAETTVELGTGQSFAIAGLLQDNSTINDSSVPFLGDLPILGALFRSNAFQRNETELVIIVTPYIVSPVSNPAALSRPDDGKPVPNDAERLLLMRQTGRPAAAAPISASRAAINAGFVVQ